MAISTGPTTKLCRWACSTRYEDLPAEVRKETVTLLYDQVGGMIASATLPSCQPVVDLVRKLDLRGECSIVGHPVRTSVTNAALANGTIGHGDEVDSTGQH
ncbi:MAG: MmgE/PrpD family protein, partial [Betaproteobacteria bacterium]|nr:MmgE/PrpD family protein [Betaproteobacteria bacterium]